MRVHLDRKLARLGSAMPWRLLRSSVEAALGDRHLALTFHRVKPPSDGDGAPGMAIREQDLDGLVDALLATRRGSGERWLSVTFDDGYEDAAAWVDSRASRFAEVEFILFVCPEKAEVGAGFRWDLTEVAMRGGADRRQAERLQSAPRDVDAENAREDLRRLGADPGFRLASVERLRALAARPNVSLGNHTNCHFEMVELEPALAQRELDRSHAAFQRLFGPQRHFAFPFGHRFFDERHLAMVRAQGDFLVWGTRQRPFAAADRAGGALLSRFVVDGRWGVRGALGAIAGRSALA